MFSTKHKNRILFITFIILTVITILCLILYALGQNLSLFYAPNDIKTQNIPKNVPIRVGGLVLENSVKRDPGSLKVHFVITDFKANLSVEYEGILPDLFREGQGIVANGVLTQNNNFLATQVLAKHDENYMPPEVKAAIS